MNRKKVLIIDDDLKNIFALAATLKAKGFENVSAGSALEGITLLENDPCIGIVLLDMMMPGMDGYEAIPVIRSHQQLENLPLIAVTAQAMQGDREKCLMAGADDYISKPIDVDILVWKINKYIN